MNFLSIQFFFSMLFDGISQIDYWRLCEGQLDQDMFDRGNNFFSKIVPEFWKNLSLMDVITFAFYYTNAAYQAYFLNFSNFKTFCDKVWKEDTLDFTLLEPITIYQFKFIVRMFEANNHIFPKNMPRNFLCHITEGTHFTFYIND